MVVLVEGKEHHDQGGKRGAPGSAWAQLSAFRSFSRSSSTGIRRSRSTELSGARSAPGWEGITSERKLEEKGPRGGGSSRELASPPRSAAS